MSSIINIPSGYFLICPHSTAGEGKRTATDYRVAEVPELHSCSRHGVTAARLTTICKLLKVHSKLVIVNVFETVTDCLVVCSLNSMILHPCIKS
jgi:hypothetical protein